MIVICYDGSPDAEAAIYRAAQLFRQESVVVLTVWEPFLEVVARTPVGFGLVPGVLDGKEIDKASERHAQETAERGAAMARAAGLDARPQVCAQVTTTSRAILAECETLGADAIVMGSRGLTGVKLLLLGSVSHEVIQHADRTVVVVPSPEVADARAGQVRKLEAAPTSN